MSAVHTILAHFDPKSCAARASANETRAVLCRSLNTKVLPAGLDYGAAIAEAGAHDAWLVESIVGTADRTESVTPAILLQSLESLLLQHLPNRQSL